MAYYGTEDYLEDKDFTDRLKAIFHGDLGLEWMRPEGEGVGAIHELPVQVPPGRFSYANIAGLVDRKRGGSLPPFLLSSRGATRVPVAPFHLIVRRKSRLFQVVG